MPSPVTVTANFVDLAGNSVVGVLSAYLIIPSGVNAFVAGTGMIAPKVVQSSLVSAPSVSLFGNDNITDQALNLNLLDTYYTVLLMDSGNRAIWKASYSFTGAGPFNLLSYPPLDTLS